MCFFQKCSCNTFIKLISSNWCVCVCVCMCVWVSLSMCVCLCVCVCVCSHRVEHDVVQAANSQDAVLWSVVVVEEEGGGKEAGQVRGERGASHLHTHTQRRTKRHTHKDNM